MHVLKAGFIVSLPFGQHAEVVWVNFPSGKPAQVDISAPGFRHVIDNAKGEWKPCATHAMDLVRLYRCQSPKSQQAKQRARKVKPVLRVCNGE